MRGLRVALSLLMLLAASGVASACGDSAGPTGDIGQGGGRIGLPCTDDSECAGAKCGSISGGNSTERVCTLPCTSDADCSNFSLARKCGVLDGGERGCTHGCPNGALICIDGVPTACSVAGDSHCAECGCPADMVCKPDVGCEKKHGVGEPCKDDFDCNTTNCSTFAHVCRVPVGQSCTIGNCDRCLSTGDGWSYCSRSCDSDFSCNGSRCIGGIDTGYFCTPGCKGFSDPACHGKCTQISNAPGQYCDCSECSVDEPLRELGQVCSLNSQCKSGSCYHFVKEVGYCSVDCSAGSGCEANLACVSVPCAPGETSTCGTKCLPLCATLKCEFPASCRTLQKAGSGSVEVCDLHREDGASCTTDAACLSGACVQTRCAAAGPLDNGMPCKLPTDCKSSNCNNGTCRGTALIGDACQTQYDCAAGGCCSTKKCGTGC